MRYTLTLTDKCNKNCDFCYENTVRKNKSLSLINLYKQLSNIISKNNTDCISFFWWRTFFRIGFNEKGFLYC